MKLSRYAAIVTGDVLINRFDKRKIAERDMISTKQIEKQIKDQIKEKLVQATKQREVCFCNMIILWVYRATRKDVI